MYAACKMLFVWLFVMLALSADGFRFQLPKCEKISIPLCSRVLPYNLTRFPNAAGDQSQALANRSIELYRSLVQRVNCSKHAVFFMCLFYLPPCFPGKENIEVIKPCRSLCEQIKSDCAEVIPVTEWENVVKCEELPEFSDNMCIQPDSFVQVSPKPTKIVNHNSRADSPPAEFNSYATKQYDYVIRFKVNLIQRLENSTVISGRVSRVLKQNNVTISKGHVKIWSNADLTNSSLLTGDVFLICGHENASEQKLLLSSTSLIEAWSRKVSDKIRWCQGREKNSSSKKKAKNVSNM